MKNLENNSLEIYPGIVVHHPRLQKDETLNLSGYILKFAGCYATNNSTVCFVNEEGRVFVTPYTKLAMKTLNDAGFKESYFYVPFSNGDVPKKEKSRWEQLREKAEQSYESDFVSDCNNWCDEHHIGTISEESLRACFCMPKSGVPVRHLYYEDRYYPICSQTTGMDCTVVERLGKYCTNNGKCAFIYRDGKTYVAKGYWILDQLQAAGYSESGIFVPFSNGEEIADPALKSRWENIPRLRK